MFNKNKPYNQLPLLPPQAEIENTSLLRKAIKANKALAKLSGSAGQLPNQNMLITSILMQESKMSSEIENIVTTNDELYKALSADKYITDPATKEVLHYNDALWEGYEFVKEKGFLSTNLFMRLFQIIKETNAGLRKTTGTKIQNKKTGEIIYTPPEGEETLKRLLKNLEDFIHDESDEPDPLIKMAVMHYQFEAIHPFSDGNGRTGRIINILYLVQQQLINLPVLYLSKYIIEHKEAYYKGLRSVTEEQKWVEWISFMMDAVEQSATYTQGKIDSILALMSETGERMKKRVPDIYNKELLEIIFSQPYCKRRLLEKALRVTVKTAGGYLNRLEAAGFLSSVKVGKEKLYINQPLYKLLKT